MTVGARLWLPGGPERCRKQHDLGVSAQRCTNHDAAAPSGDRCHRGRRGAAAGSALVGLGHAAGLGALVQVPRASELGPVVDHIGLAATISACAEGSGGGPLPAAVADAVPRALHHRLLPAELLVACRGRSVEPSAASCPAVGAQRSPGPALYRLLPAAFLHAAEPGGPSHLHVSPRLRSGLGPIEGQPHPAACVLSCLSCRLIENF
ncbi:transmembrane protein 239 isoform X1 [Herpailurus yagouaroundi]|uniref:transmembrane protein 239 isoform X1 n=1 Tax=Herpailurus yagouaroundi TaxID=1608482 RepID=UPI001AD733B3|nr:transmembrane protein 239 isoform X1 [Puma yagouaroundi]